MDKETHHHASEHEEVSASTVIETMNVSAPSRRRDLFLPISILAAAIMVGGAIVFATLYKGGAWGVGVAPAGGNAGTGTAGTGNNGNPAAATTTNASVMVLGPRDAILGNANAPVTMIEYGDYQCPYCGEFFSQTEPEIVQNYVNTGKVRFVFRNFAFLGAESTAAAEAADCAEDQNKLWAYHDALYAGKVADDSGGGSEDDGFFSTAEFLKLGQQVGLNMTTFTSCVKTTPTPTSLPKRKAMRRTSASIPRPHFLLTAR